jgi:hypothetical protein
MVGDGGRFPHEGFVDMRLLALGAESCEDGAHLRCAFPPIMVLLNPSLAPDPGSRSVARAAERLNLLANQLFLCALCVFALGVE